MLKLFGETWDVLAMQRRNHETIYRQGDPGIGVYCLLQGHVKLTRLSRAGEACTVLILKAGDWFGALDTSDRLYRETAVAKGSARLRLIPNGPPRTAADADSIIQSMARRQRFLERRLEALLFLDVRARLAAVLVNLSTFCGQHCKHGHEIDMRLTHQELCELSGVSRPVVTATLNQWRKDGLMHYTREYICIEHLETFKQLLS